MTTDQPSPQSEAKDAPRHGDDQSALVGTQGKTTIADVVVAKIAGIATGEVNGVHDLGGGASRAAGALRGRIPGASVNRSRGVSVEGMTGLEVTEADITVLDVHLDDADADGSDADGSRLGDADSGDGGDGGRDDARRARVR